jgi:DNA-directed RNA polymerase subunit RPC12/RpoP
METKRFKMIDDAFICDVCGKEVLPLNVSARDHCPYCLCSKHVDINPGDRLNPCKGVLRPVGIDKYKETFKIVYKCDKCGELHRNIMAIDDDFDMILEVAKNVK